MKKLVSVIIPAHNEEKYIDRTIRSVFQSSYKNIEVIVSLDSCTDRTEEIVRQFKSKITHCHARKPGVAKNSGAKLAKGEYLVFLDADTTISKNGISEIAKILDRCDCYGTLWVRPYPWRLLAHVLMVLKNMAFFFHIYPGSNGLIFCRKELFKKLKGFDPRLYRYEDGDFTHRALHYSEYRFISNSVVETSIRRFEKLGYFNVMYYWVRVYFQHWNGKNNGKYPVIR